MNAELPIFEPLLNATSAEEIATFMVGHTARLGYSGFFYSPLMRENQNPQFFAQAHKIREPESLGLESIFTNYPASWIGRYQQAGFIDTDPIVKMTAQSNLPVIWADLTREIRTHQVFDEAREHGLASGITMPVTGIGSERALLSFVSDVAPERSIKHTAAVVGVAMLTAVYFHEAVRRVNARKPHSQSRSLTLREKECLQWAASGKTSWEISQILSVSERTVVFHIGNACRKLQASNRRQAVARGISLGLFQL